MKRDLKSIPVGHSRRETAPLAAVGRMTRETVAIFGDWMGVET